MTGSGSASASPPVATAARRRRRRALAPAVVALLAATAIAAGWAAKSSSPPAQIVRERIALRWSPDERGALAAHRLGELRASSAVGDLTRFIERAPTTGADQAYRALATIGDARAIPFLQRAVNGEIAYTDPRLAPLLRAEDHKQALIALARLGQSDALDQILKVVGDPAGDLFLRKDLAVGLADSSGAKATELLLRVAGDEGDDRNVRLSAIKALAWSPDPARLAAAIDITQRIDDPRLLDGAVRFVAVAADGKAAPAFTALVESRPEPLRTASLLLLDDARAWSQVEGREAGLAPSIEDALYTLASARSVVQGDLLARVDRSLCRLAALRQGANTELPEEARERREVVITRTLREACG